MNFFGVIYTSYKFDNNFRIFKNLSQFPFMIYTVLYRKGYTGLQEKKHIRQKIRL